MERPVNDPAAMHRLLCDAMAEGFCVLEVEFGDGGQPRDVRPARAGQVGVVFQDVTQAKLDEFMAQSVVEHAIFMLDPAGHVRTWNAGAQRIKGYAPEEILGRPAQDGWRGPPE